MKPEKYKKLVLFFLAGSFPSCGSCVASRELIRKGYPDLQRSIPGKIVREGVRSSCTTVRTRSYQQNLRWSQHSAGPLPYIHPPWKPFCFVPSHGFRTDGLSALERPSMF